MVRHYRLGKFRGPIRTSPAGAPSSTPNYLQIISACYTQPTIQDPAPTSVTSKILQLPDTILGQIFQEWMWKRSASIKSKAATLKIIAHQQRVDRPPRLTAEEFYDDRRKKTMASEYNAHHILTTCKTFHRVAIPYLYRDIYIVGYEQLRRFCCVTPTEYFRYLRTFRSLTAYPYETASSQRGFLQDMELMNRPSRLISGPARKEQIDACVKTLGYAFQREARNRWEDTGEVKGMHGVLPSRLEFKLGRYSLVGPQLASVLHATNLIIPLNAHDDNGGESAYPVPTLKALGQPFIDQITPTHHLAIKASRLQARSLTLNIGPSNFQFWTRYLPIHWEWIGQAHQFNDVKFEATMGQGWKAWIKDEVYRGEGSQGERSTSPLAEMRGMSVRHPWFRVRLSAGKQMPHVFCRMEVDDKDLEADKLELIKTCDGVCQRTCERTWEELAVRDCVTTTAEISEKIIQWTKTMRRLK